ncbi:hypothetical protein PM082_016760 [Marasmius tenuissimus]|nr:hypothetical protein PM082_016760 [Marasmius tenuissimus]
MTARSLNGNMEITRPLDSEIPSSTHCPTRRVMNSILILVDFHPNHHLGSEAPVMSMFHSARRTKIVGGNFNIVQGNQNSTSCSHSQVSERGLVRFQPGEEWKKMLYEEYERISLGKIKILKTLCHEPVEAPRRRCITANYGDRDGPEAQRIVEIASIVDGREESLPLLAVRYAGRDAKKLFKKDCVRFALRRSSTMPQFRAFNDSDIPMIIFNEELVSAGHFLLRSLYSFHAQCYLHLQARSSALLHAFSDADPASVLSPFEPRSLLRLAWFRPQTGVLCFGPPGPHIEYEVGRSSFDSLYWHNLEGQWHRYNRLDIPPLPLNVCTNTALLEHVMHNVPEQLAVRTMSSAANSTSGPVHREVCDWKERLMTEESWARSWPSKDFSRLVLKSLSFYPWGYGHMHSSVSDRQVLPFEFTEKGEMRLLITFIINSAGFCFNRYEHRHHTREQWLAQAGWIFSRLRVPREKWSSSAIIEGFTLELSSDAGKWFEAEHDDWNEDPNSPCYLFLPPPPKLPNGAPDIETWLRGEKLYYYSYDPEGGSAITEQDRIALGLPSYTSEIYVEYVHWNADAYDFMEQWQKAKGFDYSTADYAESLGFTILEGIPKDEVCFEDLFGTHYEEVLPDDLMNVDSEFGNTRHNCNSSSLGVDMDVDG